MPRSFRFFDSKRDVADEIGFHLEMRTREFIERGMSPDEARRAAAASFGDVAAIEAACRDERAMRAREHARRDLWQGLGLDLKVAIRSLWRRPAFTAAATLTLTLGIGAAAAVFAIVSGVLLRPLPYHQPDRLVMVWVTGSDVHGAESPLPLSAPIYLDVKQGISALTPSAAFRSWPYTLSEESGPEQVAGVKATPALFSTLGARPAIGRDFTDADAAPGAQHVVLISDALWRRRWAADPSVVGKRITLSGERFTVIGVAPRGFAFPRGAELPSGLQFPMRTDVWTPLTFTDDDLKNRWTLNLAAVGGVAVAALWTRVMLALVPGQLPRADDVAVDWRVLLAGAACGLAAGTLFGIAAALHARGAPLASVLSGGSARSTGGVARTSGRRLLVGAQIAFSLVLVVAAGLLAASFVRLQRVNPGFVPEQAVTA